MLEMTRGGYIGYCSPLMLSAHAEMLASNCQVELFNWFRVSPFDPRIRESEWLDPAYCKSVLESFTVN
jgi:hypothetical protein